MKISIITINLNNRDGLKRTIESVISQTFSDFEWILIDGNSTDGSKDLIREYSSYFAYWVSETDKGIYNAMNKGVDHANGDYVIFMNSGDCFASNNVLTEASILLSDGDIIYGDVNYVQQDGIIKYVPSPEKLTLRYLYIDTICHQAAFIKRSLFLEVRYNENRKLVSDWEFFVIMYIKNKVFIHIPVIICNYDKCGASANSSLVYEERKMLFEKIFPEERLEEYQLISVVESYLANTRIEEFIRIRQKHPLLGKLLTLCVLLMKK